MTIRRKFLDKKTIILIAIILLVVVKFVFFGNKNYTFNINDFDIETVSKGNIEKIVEATGTINPVNIVEVGSQVSGIIEKIYVDYNDVVKKGQRLAVLDTDILEKDLRESLSALKQAKSNLELSKLNTQRTRELYKNNYIAKAELDEAETQLITYTENYNIAKSQYEKAKTQLNYAYINSPVSGTVITRDVDEGQTVASSFSAPVLFTIAEDLTKMQIETSISEADIGMIKKNQDIRVTFTVDAYKNKEFTGKIRQVRLGSTVESNVVVYNVVIDIDNKDGLLLPGMTAYVSLLIDSAENVLRIPNTALRFKASKKVREAMGLQPITEEEKQELVEKYKTGKYTYIYILDKNNKPKGMMVEKGLSDITYTEIKDENLKVGDKVISAYLIKDGK